MSLINKMLQDLDARGGASERSGSLGAEIRAVPPLAPGKSRFGAAVAGALVIVAVAAGAAWWFARSAPPPAASVASPAALAAPAAVRPAGPAQSPAADPPQQITPPEQMVDPAAIAAGQAAADAGGGRGTAAGRNGVVERRTETDAAAADKTGVPRPKAAREREMAAVTRRAVAERPARANVAKGSAGVRPAQGAKNTAGSTAAAGAAGTGGTGGAGDAGASPQQRAAVLFQRAQARLVEARVGEAIVNLEAALQIDPRHEAARQTLASLLVENGRHADAARILQQGLALDPRQTSMAMLLARLQLEHGGPAIDTLQTSLPYAQNNADYRALMAGMLQRAQRHNEAIEHYTAAVQLQPAQGIWWMGLGISLQAEQRATEAKAAFTRARESGRLNPDLQGFVERKLQQLGN